MQRNFVNNEGTRLVWNVKSVIESFRTVSVIRKRGLRHGHCLIAMWFRESAQLPKFDCDSQVSNLVIADVRIIVHLGNCF